MPGYGVIEKPAGAADANAADIFFRQIRNLLKLFGIPIDYLIFPPCEKIMCRLPESRRGMLTDPVSNLSYSFVSGEKITDPGESVVDHPSASQFFPVR